MKLASPAFAHNQSIPTKFTCQGDDINPTLQIEEVPEDAQSLTLIMDDPDAPMPGGFVHWVVFNINPDTKGVSENSEPGGVNGNNSDSKTGYIGPCPPSGTHRYFFKLYALDTKLDLLEGASREEVEKAMSGHILGQAELIGLYQKTS